METTRPPTGPVPGRIRPLEEIASPTRPGILVVDDEPALRGLLQTVLLRRGFAVWLADGGRSAVEIYRENEADIAVVLLDVRMPEMDGPKTLAALRRINPAVVCCFMSGHTGEHTPESLLGLGAVRLFAKPFRIDDMAQVLWQTAQCASGGRPDPAGEGQEPSRAPLAVAAPSRLPRRNPLSTPIRRWQYPCRSFRNPSRPGRASTHGVKRRRRRRQEKGRRWIKTVLGMVGGMLSGAVVMYATACLDNAVKPAKPVPNFRVQHEGRTVTLPEPFARLAPAGGTSATAPS